jgi:hypothetical protein
MKGLYGMVFLGMVIGLIAIFAFAAQAFAEERSISIAVGCSIPAVPGLNAPLITAEALDQDNGADAEENAGNQNESKSDEGKILLAQNISSHSGKMVDTIYSR